MTFAKRLTRLILSTGMNYAEFSEWVGMSDHTLRGWAKGEAEPKGLAELRAKKEEEGLTWTQVMSDADHMRSMRQLGNIKRLTGCTWEELLGGE